MKEENKNEVPKRLFNIINFELSDVFFWPTLIYKDLIKPISDLNNIKLSQEELDFLNQSIENTTEELRSNKDEIEILPLFNDLLKATKRIGGPLGEVDKEVKK